MKPLRLLILILVLLLPIDTLSGQEEFDPFPQNRGTIYEYSDEDIPDICFFPIEKARWDGSRITATEWGILTDFQKSMFISEYIEQLEEEYGTTIEVDGWRYLIALNSYANTCGNECVGIPMTRVIKELLIEQDEIR